MLALCVDDEAPLLAELVRAAEASPDITEVVSFRLCSEAIDWVKSNKPDIAFLDIRMRGMTGLELSEKLRKIYPALPIVFCTGYRDFAFDAMQLKVQGYLLKPIRPEDVQREIDYIKSNQNGENKSSKLLKVQCFGNFEVFAKGKTIHFKRKRAKELLAFLVDRRGSSVNAKEICAAFWEDDENDKNLMNLYKIFGELKNALASVGAEEVLVKGTQEYSINTELIDCDFYKYIAGDPVAEKSFMGEYMVQYSWAEVTAASLY